MSRDLTDTLWGHRMDESVKIPIPAYGETQGQRCDTAAGRRNGPLKEVGKGCAVKYTRLAEL